MNPIKISKIFASFLLVFFCFVNNFASQNEDTLTVNKEMAFPLKKGESKTVYLNLKKGDFAEIEWSDSLQRFPAFLLITPSGDNLLKEIYVTETIPFIAPETGKYTFEVKFDEYEDQKEDAKITLGLSNVFKLPKTAKLQRQKKINGYDAKVFNDENSSNTFLLIEKNGKLQEILKGGSLVGGGFNFADSATLFDFPEGKKSTALMRTTVDKTGEGTPDVAVQFYSGGAHCCIDLHFFELGTGGVKVVKTVEGMDSDVLAIGKKPGGSLILKTGDSTFAYWQVCFACSPIPTVILSFQNGEYRPDLKLMKKPSPALTVLKAKAAKERKTMDLSLYMGVEEIGGSGFSDAFWGEMLDLMYAGNETAAWQYLDMVWDSRKPGKEKFKDDFLNQLNKSDYWRMMQQDKLSLNNSQK